MGELKEIKEEKRIEKRRELKKMIESELFIGMVNLDTNMKKEVATRMINQQLLPMSENIPKHLQAVKTAVKLFDDFCHKRWDELKVEATKEGMVLASFLELVSDSRGDPVCIERINHEWRKTNLKK